MPLDLERYRASGADAAAAKIVRRSARRTGVRFLKGPVPLPWLEAAARLPGKSMHVGIALWYAAGLTRSQTVSLSNIAGLRFGLERNAKYRALQWLEEAGLVRVVRVVGRAPVVTLLDRVEDMP